MAVQNNILTLDAFVYSIQVCFWTFIYMRFSMLPSGVCGVMRLINFLICSWKPKTVILKNVQVYSWKFLIMICDQGWKLAPATGQMRVSLWSRGKFEQCHHGGFKFEQKKRRLICSPDLSWAAMRMCCSKCRYAIRAGTKMCRRQIGWSVASLDESRARLVHES